jgi:hemoglobin-like flavoprotein
MDSELESLSRDDIRLVQESFDQLWPTAKTAELFYTRLFEIAPHIRPMFRNVPDMAKQCDKFTATLAMLIWSLDDHAKLLPAVEMLAKHHVQYGVEPAHYATLGQALMWTLEQRLEGEWNDAIAAAWARAYRLLSRHMIEHAYGANGGNASPA